MRSSLLHVNLSGCYHQGRHLDSVPSGITSNATELDLSENYITNISVKSFSNLRNLTKLDLSWANKNHAVNIVANVFKNLTKLNHLSLTGNCLNETPSNLPHSVEILELNNNKIILLDNSSFAVMTKLEALDLSFNNLTRVPTGLPPSLTMLMLGSNKIPYISEDDFHGLHNLKILKIQGNCPRCQNAPYPCVPCQKTSLGIHPYAFHNLTQLETLHLGRKLIDLPEYTLSPLYGLRNLSALNLGTNFIIKSDSKIFSKFQQLKMIYLAENRLYPSPVKSIANPSDGFHQRLDLSISPYIKPHTDFAYDVSHSLIKQECFDSGRVLILSSNNLFFISPKQFEGYGNIACLNLSGNGFSAALNGTEFSSLPNLTYLDLSFNKIDLAYDNAFIELQKLKVLDLSYNPVLNMSHNAISILTTKQMHSKSLSELQFTDNNLGTLWKERDGSYEMLFTNLTNLTILDISQNRITKIPDNVYERLPHNLTKLRISGNSLTDFKWNRLKCFHQLQILDLSFNSLSHVKGINSNITQSLTFLDLSHNHIFHLDDGFIKGPKSLTTLSLSNNKLTTINQSTLLSISNNQIKTLFLQQNPFQCTCYSFEFILWIENSNVKIPRLTTKVKCATPENQKGRALIYFDINQCVNDSQAFQIYILITSFIFAFMFVTTVAHLFYWDASYVVHFMKARLKGYRSLNSPESVYDVFVTYDTRDPHVSEWVMKNLRVKLEEEGETHLPLCLEERDWPLGVPLVDNLTQSIQYSRKTLFVLTEGYVKTGVFKLAMYLAHQRLLDENVDVIVLLMLEPVLQHSHFLRLRRRLCEKSVVEWPRTAAAEAWFWQNLRSVVRVDNQIMYNKTYSKYFTNK
uniref:TIR domain-containing protein n=1 Tax=Lates calcarifer TaxID=8187 RepID=A0A4W6FF05_LATCA